MIEKASINSLVNIIPDREKLEFLEDFLEKIAKEYKNILSGLVKSFKNFGAQLQSMIDSLLEKLSKVSKYFVAFAIGGIIFELVLDAVIAFFTGGTSLAVKAVQKISRMADKLAELAQKGVKVARKAVQTVAENTAALMRGIRKFIDELLQAIKDGKFVEWVKEKILHLVDDTVDEIKSLLPENQLTARAAKARLSKINALLKKSTVVFNPEKPALKKLSIKLFKSKNGLCVDFKKTPKYLYGGKANSKSVVKIKLKGSRDLDFKTAWEKAGFTNEEIKKYDKLYTWHHLDDYDPITGEATMQLVEMFIHGKSRPHIGSVKLVEAFFGIIYK